MRAAAPVSRSDEDEGADQPPVPAPEPGRSSSLTRRGFVAGGVVLGVATAWGLVARRTQPGPAAPTPSGAAPGAAGCRSVPVVGCLATREAYDAAEATYRRGQGARPASTVGGGLLAWGESRVDQSYLTMYAATRDPVYLDKLVAACEALLAARDDRTGQVDHQGRSLPAWGAGEPYTVSCVDLPDADGLPGLRLASTTVRSGGTVGVGWRDPDLFDLVVTAPGGHGETVAGLSLDPRHPRYVVPVLARRYPGFAGLTATDLRPEARRSPRLATVTGAALVAQRSVFAVHTGMICAPMAGLAALLVREPDLARRYAGPVADLLEAAELAVHVHDPEWRSLGATTGLYAFAAGAPVWADGTALPHNQYLVMARCQVQLFLATGDPTYRRRARKMLALVQTDLGTGGAPTWPYYWTGSPVYRGYELGETDSVYSPRLAPYRVAEDPSHGALDVDALVAGHDAGLDVPRSVLTRLASTFHTHVVRRGPGGSWTTPVRFGAADDLPVNDFAAARWLELARWDRSVYTTISALLEQARPSMANYQVLPVIAQLVRLA